jgi:hypothetical protein
MVKARAFYETFFGFRFAFEEKAEGLVFLRDDADFLLALHQSEDGKAVDFPSWFHFGFCRDSLKHEKMISLS